MNRFRSIPYALFSLAMLSAMHDTSSFGADEAGAPVQSNQAAQVNSTIHDFDFLVGRWTVQHRKLKGRLVHSTEWETFSGTCETRLILGGQADVDDNLLRLPDGEYRAATMRVFDPSTKIWAIWWFDGRHPHDLDPPVVGGFRKGVGMFYADDHLNGKPIKVRFIWSGITPHSARWEQAFSEDGGITWETNWVMEFSREG
jgi:hypothetical protein